MHCPNSAIVAVRWPSRYAPFDPVKIFGKCVPSLKSLKLEVDSIRWHEIFYWRIGTDIRLCIIWLAAQAIERASAGASLAFVNRDHKR